MIVPERDQERDLAERLVRAEPADRDEERLQRPADQARRPSPAMPMRAPTIMPAPKVDADRSIAPSSAHLGAADAARPTPSADAAAERADRVPEQRGSVSARRMFATARPDGKVELQAVDQDRRVEHADADAEHADARRCRAISCHAGGCGMPIHDHRLDEHAPSPLMPATEAAVVWM